jgi:hypothetical protein
MIDMMGWNATAVRRAPVYEPEFLEMASAVTAGELPKRMWTLVSAVGQMESPQVLQNMPE